MKFGRYITALLSLYMKKNSEGIEMEIIVSLGISVASAVLSGIVLYKYKNGIKKSEAAEQKKNEQKVSENILILRSLNAVGKLTVANSVALRDGKANGTMETALEEYEAIQAELYNYLLNVNARK